MHLVSIQRALVCVFSSGSAVHPGSLLRGGGDGNGRTGQLVDHRGPLFLRGDGRHTQH